MFFGREEYFESLSKLWQKKTASLVTCRGRRRIGKSTLIEEFAHRSDAKFIAISGLPPASGMTNDAQLSNFAIMLSSQAPVLNVPADNWYNAFRVLDSIIGEERTVVLLDEVSWMGKYDKNFPGYLKNAWDMHLKKHSKLIVVLCGSVSTWITDNILNNTGFVGRRSMDLLVKELPLRDCVRFWGDAQSRTSTSEILDILSITGGVPRYLEDINHGVSVDENVLEMCFKPEGLLFREFGEIFSDVFGSRSSLKYEILDALADQSLSGQELAEKLYKDNNTCLLANLSELEVAGFITKENPVNPKTFKKSRTSRYRLSDNYFRFYLRCIRPNADAVEQGLFRNLSLGQLPGWEAVLGLQFENLILNNLPALLSRLGLSRTLILSAAPFRQKPTKGSPGFQVDLLLQTKRSLYVVEIKRRKHIAPSVIDEVAQKVKALGQPANVSVKTVLVYDGQLAPSIENDGYFDFIVSSSEFLI